MRRVATGPADAKEGLWRPPPPGQLTACAWRLGTHLLTPKAAETPQCEASAGARKWQGRHQGGFSPARDPGGTGSPALPGDSCGKQGDPGGWGEVALRPPTRLLPPQAADSWALRPLLSLPRVSPELGLGAAWERRRGLFRREDRSASFFSETGVFSGVLETFILRNKESVGPAAATLVWAWLQPHAACHHKMPRTQCLQGGSSSLRAGPSGSRPDSSVLPRQLSEWPPREAEPAGQSWAPAPSWEPAEV